MYRPTLLRLARSAVAQARPRPAVTAAIQRTPFLTVSSRRTPAVNIISAVRCYASSSGLSKDEVTGRILDLLKNFDKVRNALLPSPRRYEVFG